MIILANEVRETEAEICLKRGGAREVLNQDRVSFVGAITQPVLNKRRGNG